MEATGGYERALVAALGRPGTIGAERSHAMNDSAPWAGLEGADLPGQLVLVGCGISYAEYRKSTEILSILLGPATVALAVPGLAPLARSASITDQTAAKWSGP